MLMCARGVYMAGDLVFGLISCACGKRFGVSCPAEFPCWSAGA